MELAIDSRPILLPSAPENIEPVEAVETQRESSGQAPMAGVGEGDGEGESRRNEGCSRSSCVFAMVVNCWCFRMIMLRRRLYVVPVTVLVGNEWSTGTNARECHQRWPAAASSAFRRDDCRRREWLFRKVAILGMSVVGNGDGVGVGMVLRTCRCDRAQTGVRVSFERLRIVRRICITMIRNLGGQFAKGRLSK